MNLGFIVTGSLLDGFVMRINNNVQIENIKTGNFVSISGVDYIFLSIITNLKLESSNPEIISFPPSIDEILLKNILQKKIIYATANLKPILMLSKINDSIIPIKTIPSHFSTVYETTATEINKIFGDEKDPSKKYFYIGTPLEMNTKICLNLEKITERNSGIFGKTGTGKTFLTRLLLAGCIKNKKAVVLIFDMHSEYGITAREEKNSKFVKGLKSLFPSNVAIFSLDSSTTQKRNITPDVLVNITYSDISIEDIISLQAELNLHPTALEAAYLIYSKYKKDWLCALLEAGDNIKNFAENIGAHPESIAALYRKLKRIEKLSFIKKNLNDKNSVITKLIEFIEKEINIVFEFGSYSSSFCYLLIANIITRKIHSEYIKKTEHFLETKELQNKPNQLMIVIEEAHKFLNPESKQQTIFGTIAREMRKYYVSLCIVDQRPSGIDSEIISQIGTKIIAQLDDEKDIQAVLSGSNNTIMLRTMLASLSNNQQVLITGHALPMPLIIKARNYDETFYADMENNRAASCSTESIISQLY